MYIDQNFITIKYIITLLTEYILSSLLNNVFDLFFNLSYSFLVNKILYHILIELLLWIEIVISEIFIV